MQAAHPWSGRYDGAGATSFGDPTWPDGPEHYRDAYRHIIDIFRQEGATNVTFVFQTNTIDGGYLPGSYWEPFQQMKHYYPGDDYIDWLGLSAAGSVDVLDPASLASAPLAYGPWIAGFLHVPGTVFTQVPGALFEHVDFHFGPKANALLKQLWFRRAVAMAIDRNAAIDAAYKSLATGMRTRDNLPLRDELARVGIALGDDGLTAAQLFGVNGIASGDDDLVEFAWGFFDPGSGASEWSCNGTSNYLDYCNKTVTALLQAGLHETDSTKAGRDFRRADALLAADVPSIPLYDRPWPIVRATHLLGVRDNPLQTITWNVEDWRWSG